MMVYIVMVLSIRMAARMKDMLRRDGRLYELSTWRSGARFLLGPKGFFEVIGRDFFAYFRADFHPWQIDDSGLVREWEREREAQAALAMEGVAS
jgi:predicted metal-dependent hydrolase